MVDINSNVNKCALGFIYYHLGAFGHLSPLITIPPWLAYIFFLTDSLSLLSMTYTYSGCPKYNPRPKYNPFSNFRLY